MPNGDPRPATDPPRWQLLLVGSASVQRSGGTALALAPRDAALLAWLALEGPTARTRLAALLWPGSEPDAARNSLRQRLFKLRSTLGMEIVAGTSTLALAEGVTHDLDDADTLLDQAAGEDLPAGEFAQWLEAQRARRRERLRRALAEQADAAEAARDWDPALIHARDLLALEPLSEAAHRRLMRLHYLHGDRAAALLAFDRCERVLKDEIGTRPAPETLALLASIDGSGASASSVAAAALAVAGNAPPAAVLRPPRMVGRDAELAQLAQGWTAGQVVAVIGEAGLGKSRLLQDFAALQSAVVHVAARPGDSGVPLATLARLLRAVLALAPQPLAIAAATRSEIARVLPEFDAVLPRAGGEGQRLVLQRAVQALLGAQAAQVGLAGLLVDDLHFADEASLDMLRALIDEPAAPGDEAASDASAPALRWVLAYRPAEAVSPLHALHDALIEQARLRPLPLRPLDVQALAELVDSLGLPGVDGRALAPGLLKRTGGNPLFVLETLKQAWVERSLDRLADAQHLPRPLSVGRLIERRITQLSPGALAMARVASIAGVDFEIELAEQVLGASAMQFADAINELETAQVMRGNAFAHDLVFDAVQSSVPATVAARTHAQVAAWLEPRGGEPARIAGHWIDAGQERRALPWLQQAADAARRALRARECIAFLERKSEIEESLGDCQAAFASLLEAEERADTDVDPAVGAAHCARLEALASTPEHRVEALLQRAQFQKKRFAWHQLDALAREAWHRSVALADLRLTMRARISLSSACVSTDRLEEGAQHIEAVAAWVDEHGNDTDRAEINCNLALLYVHLGRLDDAKPHHELSLDHAQRSGNLSNASLACANLAYNRIYVGDLYAAEHSLQKGQQLLTAYDGFSPYAGNLHALRARCLSHLGRYVEAQAQAEQAVAATRLHHPEFLNLARVCLAVCWWHLGQWARLARELAGIEIGVEAFPTVRVQLARLRWQLALGSRAPAAARNEAWQALAAEQVASSAAGPLDLRLFLLIDLADTNDASAGLRQLDAVRIQAERIGHRSSVLAAHIRAAGLACHSDPQRARVEALAALELAREHQTTALLPAELWLQCGRALAAAGDHAHAASVVTQGRDWLHTTAREHVTEAFRDSFLNRNPVNRELLALAARTTQR